MRLQSAEWLRISRIASAKWRLAGVERVGFGSGAGGGNNHAVGGKVGNVQFEGQPALCCSCNIAGASHLHIGLGNDETIGC